MGSIGRLSRSRLLLATVAVATVGLFVGQAPQIAAAPSGPLTVVPDPLDFGNVVVGTETTRTVRVTNNTGEPAVFLGIVLAQAVPLGESPPLSVERNTCVGELGVGASCEVDLAVKPSAMGPVTGNLGFTTVDVIQRRSIDVSAQGVANQAPIGGIPLSLTQGRGYGALVWAFDPDDRLAARIRMHIPDVVTRESDSNYHWADMPHHTGYDRHDATVFLAQLPPGTHDICFDALDRQTGEWHRIGCRLHTVK